MGYLYVMNLSGIQGESAFENHDNEIEVNELIQEYEAPSELDKISLLDKSNIRPAVTCHGITIKKTYDKSTPNLLSFLTEGKQIDAGTIYCINPEKVAFLNIELKQLIVRKIRTYFDANDAGVEINFSYSEISHTYTPDGAKKALFDYKKEIPFG